MEIHGMTPPPCARLPAEMVGRKESPFTQSEAEAEADPFQPSEERAAEPRFLPELPTGLGAGFADRWTPNTAPLATFGPARPNP